jgi:hypothetical protein
MKSIIMVLAIISAVNSWTDFDFDVISDEKEDKVSIPEGPISVAINHRRRRDDDDDDDDDDDHANDIPDNHFDSIGDAENPLISTNSKVNNETSDEKEDFYLALHAALQDESNLKRYIRRVDCVVETLRTKEAFDEVGVDEGEVITDHVNGKKIYSFRQRDAVIERLRDSTDSANLGCLAPGVFSVCILLIICGFVISCLICLVRGDPPAAAAV